MTREQIAEMFAGVPAELFRVHNWRTGITTVGEVPAAFVARSLRGRGGFSVARADGQSDRHRQATI